MQTELLEQISQPIGQARQTPLSRVVALLHVRQVRSSWHLSQFGGQVRQSPEMLERT